MRLFDLIAAMDPAVTIDQSKVHLATWNGDENPLDVYLAGGFEDWQRRQSKRNFECNFVVALIKLTGDDRWLYAGVHTSTGCIWQEDQNYWLYSLQEHVPCSEFNGRLVVQFARSGRQPYVYAESVADSMFISEIRAKRLTISEFPGYKAVDLTRQQLEQVVDQDIESWRTALRCVAGVYLISDETTGKLYVGSAIGEGGIWARWCLYRSNGHGGNKELKELLDREGSNRSEAFRYSVLEIADTHASEKDIRGRESHWKRVLVTREHGWNAN